MSVDHRILDNRDSAESLGWAPADFGCAAFDYALVGAIAAFQRDHFLDPTGVCDATTWRAVLGIRRGLADAAIDRDREENLRGLGSVSRYDPDDPYVTRSAAFAGRVGWATSGDGGDAARGFHEIADRRGADAIVLGMDHAPLAPRGSTRVLAYLGLDLFFDPWATGREAAARTGGIDGLVIGVSSRVWDRVVAEAGEPIVALLKSLGNRSSIPRAVVADLVGPRGGSSIEYRRAWRVLSGFDVVMPVIPSASKDRDRTAPEYQIGQASAEWSIYGGRRPSVMFPLIDAMRAPVDPNFVHRIRAWCSGRGIRGIGYRGPDRGALADAFWNPLPDRIGRVDYKDGRSK